MVVLCAVDMATNTNFSIDDGTGSIDVKQWTDADETDYMLGVKQVPAARSSGTLADGCDVQDLHLLLTQRLPTA